MAAGLPSVLATGDTTIDSGTHILTANTTVIMQLSVQCDGVMVNDTHIVFYGINLPAESDLPIDYDVGTGDTTITAMAGGTHNVTADAVPTASNEAANTTVAGSAVAFSCRWEDETDLIGGGYIFNTNNTGVSSNASYVAFSSNPGWANVTTMTLNATGGIPIGYRWFANDSSDNWGDTGINAIITTIGETAEPPYEIPTETTILGLVIMFVMFITNTFFYIRKIEPKIYMLTTTLFAVLMNVLSLGFGMPFTPYLQLFLCIIELVMFIYSSY